MRYQLRYSPWNVDKANRHALPGANQIPRRADRLPGRAATSADGSRASNGTRAVALRVLGGLAGCFPAGLVALDGGAAQGSHPLDGSAIMLAPYGRLLGGDPVAAALADPVHPGCRHCPPAQVDHVRHEHHEADRGAHPEARSDQYHAGQFHDVEQYQRQQYPTPAVQRGRYRAPSWRTPYATPPTT